MIEIDYIHSEYSVDRCHVRVREVRVYENHQQMYNPKYIYERCHQTYYSTYNDAIIPCFIFLGFIVSSTGRYPPIYWNTTKELLRAADNLRKLDE